MDAYSVAQAVSLCSVLVLRAGEGRKLTACATVRQTLSAGRPFHLRLV